MKILAVFNQVKEIGKTTTAINLGHALALAGQKVTLIDISLSGDLAKGFGFDNNSPGLDSVLLDDARIDEVIRNARENLRIVRSGSKLADYENASTGGSQRAHTLRKAIENSSLSNDDFVLIDCSSTLGLLSLNALFACQHVMLPMSSKYESLEGLTRSMDIIRRSAKLCGHTIKIWLVSVRFDNRKNLCSEVRRRVMAYFPNRTFHTVIRELDDLAISRSKYQTIFDEHSHSYAAEDFKSLALDVVKGRIS